MGHGARVSIYYYYYYYVYSIYILIYKTIYTVKPYKDIWRGGRNSGPCLYPPIIYQVVHVVYCHCLTVLLNMMIYWLPPPAVYKMMAGMGGGGRQDAGSL